MLQKKKIGESCVAIAAVLLLTPAALLAQESQIQREKLPAEVVRPTETTETRYVKPASDEALPVTSKKNTPDERLLWNMLHNNKLQLLQQAIESWRQEYPGWQPPVEMVRALDDNLAAEQRSTAAPGGVNPAANSNAAQKKPEGCQNLAGLADSLPASEYARLAQLQKVVSQCHTAADRKAVLEIGQPFLQPESFDQLLKSVTDTTGLDVVEIEYDQHRYWLTRLINGNDHSAVGTLLQHMDDSIERNRDVMLAGAVAWYNFDQQQYAASSKWFALCREWQPDRAEMIYGMTLSLYKEGRLDEAQPLAERYRDQIPEMSGLIGEMIMQRGWQQYQQQNYHTSIELATESRSLLESQQSADMLVAWSYFQLADYQQSRALAERHQQLPQAQQLLELIRQREQPAAPVVLPVADAPVVAVASGDELYGRKLFLAAAATGDKPLQAIDSASLEAGLIWRHKSGTSGSSKLDIYHLPVFAGHYIHNNVHEFSLTALRTTLRSGSVNLVGGPVGSTGLNGEIPASDPVTELNSGTAYRFDYQKSGWGTPSFSLGLTPSGGAVATGLTYELGYKQQIKAGYWRLGLYSRPVRESVLSYTGMYDPYSSVSWGRVLKQGGEGEVLYLWSDNWSSFANLTVADLKGESVADNSTYSLSLTLGRNIKVNGFNYFTVGPEIAYQHYDRNFSHFTLGHGGYFSPDSLLRFGLGINYLTEEGRRYVIKGRFSFGYQKQDEAAELWFPNVGDFDPLLTTGGTTNSYAGSSDSGLVYDAELKGVYLLTPRWQLSGGAVVRDSSGYRDFSVAVGLRYYFDSRIASFSSDIPEWMFNAVY